MIGSYEVVLARSARKELEVLSHNLMNRILVKIEALGDAPRPGGCRKLQGSGDLYRIRIGDYRVLYEVDDARRMVDVIAVRHRSEAYR